MEIESKKVCYYLEIDSYFPLCVTESLDNIEEKIKELVEARPYKTVLSVDKIIDDEDWDYVIHYLGNYSEAISVVEIPLI